MFHWFAATVKFAVVWFPLPPILTTTPVDAGGPTGSAVTVAVTVTVAVAGEAAAALGDAGGSASLVGGVLGDGDGESDVAWAGALLALEWPIAMPPTSAMPASATTPSTAGTIRLVRCSGIDIAAFSGRETRREIGGTRRPRARVALRAAARSAADGRWVGRNRCAQWRR